MVQKEKKKEKKRKLTTGTPVAVGLFTLLCWVVVSDIAGPEAGAWVFAAAFFGFLGYCALNCVVDVHRFLYDHEHGLRNRKRHS